MLGAAFCGRCPGFSENISGEVVTTGCGWEEGPAGKIQGEWAGGKRQWRSHSYGGFVKMTEQENALYSILYRRWAQSSSVCQGLRKGAAKLLSESPGRRFSCLNVYKKPFGTAWERQFSGLTQPKYTDLERRFHDKTLLWFVCAFRLEQEAGWWCCPEQSKKGVL